MYLIFPTMLAQSIAVGYTGKSPNVLVSIERQVDTGLRDARNKPITRWEYMASERMPFTLAVKLQAELNARRAKSDERFGQDFGPKLILPR